MYRRADPALIAAAALTGGAGVALAAVAAHRMQSPALAVAANMLILHAAATIACVAAATIVSNPRAWRVATAVLLAGAIIFSGAIAGSQLFGFAGIGAAAPFGGMAMIGAWGALALLAAIGASRRN